MNKQAIISNPFGSAIAEFTLVVPVNYNHDSQIGQFVKRNRNSETTQIVDSNLTSENFSRATDRLEPGRTYPVKLFPIIEFASGKECVEQSLADGGLLVGPRAVTLLYDVDIFKIPTETAVVAFDQPEQLWECDRHHLKIPVIGRYSSGKYRVYLGKFHRPWDKVHAVMWVGRPL